ncbi:acetyl-CoA acetyltransferase [Spongiibacter sp. KMU-166]|uniref:Acetyl-CoA acetyltransferase n=1 Tax=Spongiibacter thalassae TaxID=2721624 RepID=A0ABX1GIA7_9GAMM|nr:enoyl-CoA hydratase-related protein [Spongiibacter thalassae]NKI18701.1 acetyl-CoA acetyltransferase [Spongiibacter thalassae]
MAAKRALADCEYIGIAEHIDTIVGVRIFADSSPAWSSPFGSPDNFPRAVGRRLGITPKDAIYATVGGQTPQALVGEFSEKLHKGSCEAVLLVGGEVMANIKAASRQGVKLNWSENIEGSLEDRGLTDGDHLATSIEFEHQLLQPMQFYGFMEQARRADLGEDISEYRKEMGNTFAKLSQIAANNPHAQFPQAYTPNELTEPNDKNRMIVSPFTRNLVAKDSVNQAAAVVLTTVGKAKSLGIPESKWVYLHGYSNTKERTLLERPRIGYSKGMEQSLLGALAAAGKQTQDIQHFDIYSCFPVVVHQARDILGIAANDPRPLSQTGGLPYFGGPGNNYSTHGLVSLVESLRKEPGSYGLLYANGGWMSKHAAGIYSTTPPSEAWQPAPSTHLQANVDAEAPIEMEAKPSGEAVLESYIINYFKGQPLNSVVIGKLKSNGKRFYALNAFEDSETLARTLSDKMLGSTIFVEADPRGNRYAYSRETLQQYLPPVIDEFQEDYQYCRVERIGKVLKVTINRPEVRNALNPAANQELENIFNAYEKDKNLWVAILTGAGSEAFSAGNDLKAMASGEPFWVPKTGFAGLTARPNRVKPIIAAVNGSALGGGLEIALACDIIVSANHAIFGLPEVKVGLFAGMGGIQRLTRQIGLKKAMEMLLTGKSVTADEASELGLVNHVVAKEALDEHAMNLAELICDSAPVAVRSTMQLLNETAGFASIDDAVTQPHRVFDNLLNSEDFFEGSKAFAEKRKPRWTGR